MVAKFVQPDSTTQTGTTYKGSIDAAVAVLAEQAAQFAVTAQDTPNLTVAMHAGRILQADSLMQFGGTILTVAAQNSAALTAPTVNPRNDIVYYDATTGAIGVATGTEAASPVDPTTTVPVNKVLAARIRWTVGMASITNGAIDDLRTPSMAKRSGIHNNASGQTFATTMGNVVGVNIGQVEVGQIFIVAAKARGGTKGGTAGDVTLRIYQSAGTAVVMFAGVDEETDMRQPSVPAGAIVSLAVSAIFRVTTAGTLALTLAGESLGSTTTGLQCAIHSLQLPG